MSLGLKRLRGSFLGQCQTWSFLFQWREGRSDHVYHVLCRHWRHGISRQHTQADFQQRCILMLINIYYLCQQGKWQV
ncbi:hypothetical protein XELAEV_18044944mg [Xenopus laevis]|uniref:Uncharacterized protein n=1 Tax=Xenopus laevis TaxID=8355 RepID=A0A974BZT0_XENLA|nr:hypothetical protein XELAEV_18044944mg [Xenopus laevis]